MRLYPLDALTDAHDYLAPHALNAEAAQAVTRGNRLDRWALAGRLTHDKIATDAFGRVRYRAHSTTQTTALGAVETPAVTTIPVLDTVGAPWVETFDARGGYLEVSAHLDMSGLNPPTVITPPALTAESEAWTWRLVVVINGLRVATAPITASHHNGRDVAHAMAHVPVAAGPCVVEVLVDVAVGQASGAAAATVTYRDRQLLIVEACR